MAGSYCLSDTKFLVNHVDMARLHISTISVPWSQQLAIPTTPSIHLDPNPFRIHPMKRVEEIMHDLHISDIRLEKLEVESSGNE